MNLEQNLFLKRMQVYAPSIVRIAVSFVFLWFGVNQLFFPNDFMGYLPAWTMQDQMGMEHMLHTTVVMMHATPSGLLIMNGLLEIVLGVLLLLGVFTRISALLLGLHLLGITLTLGYNEIAIRDFGLSFATLSIFFQGPDKLCWDVWRKKE